jgi:hypothetical protein
MDAVPWENLPTDERSKQWFEKEWVPLCEHMYIDPYVKPRFLDNPNYYNFMRKEWEKNNEEGHYVHDELGEKATIALHQKLSAVPWTTEEYPHVARWVEERASVLDLFGVAVRKPNFAYWRQRPEGGNVYAALFPDIHSNRIFARDLEIRITERLGKGDIDGAWDDAMSMLYLSRKHYIHDPILVTRLVGMQIESMGLESAKIVLQHGKATTEQLERFASELTALSQKMVLISEFERKGAYMGLQTLQSNKEDFEALIGGTGKRPYSDLTSFFIYLWGGVGDSYSSNYIPRYLTLLPFDRNIAGKRITEFLQTERRLSGDSTWNINSTVMKKVTYETEQMGIAKGWWTHRPAHFWQVPLIRTRSQLLGDHMISLFSPAFLFAQEALDRANTRLELLRMMVALERYKSDNENYPETLDALIPKYLEEVPLDPFTGRLSWTYKLAPDAETAVLLHSSEWDADEYYKAKLCVRIAK